MNLNTVSEIDALDTLLADLGVAEDEIIEQPTPTEEIIGEAQLEAAVASAESHEVVAAIYNEEEALHEKREALLNEECLLDPLSHPEALLSEDIGAGSGDAPAEKPKKEKKPKVEKKAATPKTPKEPKEKKAPVRKHYASKAERITDKLGASLSDYLVLELSDAALTGEDLAAKQAETMVALKEAGVKVANRMTFLIEFAAGKSSKLNDIATKALQLLKTDGKITTGEKGNLFAELSKKYAKSSANAMGNNSISALRALKMITKGEDGYIANPNSLYLAKINGMLSLS